MAGINRSTWKKPCPNVTVNPGHRSQTPFTNRMSHGTVSFRAREGVNVVAVISKESFFVIWQLHSESSEATKKTVLTFRNRASYI